MVEVKIVKTQSGINLENAVKKLQDKVAKVGWFAKSKYDDKNHTPVAHVAAINEYGSPSNNIPARPFIRPTIAKQQKKWIEIATIGAKKIVKDESTVSDILELLGQKAQGDISKAITEVFSPPLKPSTIRARINRYANDIELAKSTRKRRRKQLQKFVPAALYKPLIDTGLMLASITHTVEDE